MIQDTLLSKSLQLSQWVLHSQRENLENELSSGWSTDTSQAIDACLVLEAAIGWFSRNLVPLQPDRSLRDDPHGFEAVGSILPRVLRGIEDAARSSRERGAR